MAFSPWTLFGQGLGGGFNQGFQNQLGFQNTLKRADQLSQLPDAQQSLALALLGGGRGQQGNPVDMILAQLLAKQLGLGGAEEVPSQQDPTIKTNENPQSGVANLIRSDEAKGFGVYELNGDGYKPITQEQVDELLKQGAKKVQ